MKEKLYYMIGLLIGSNRLHKGYRVINKFTFEVKDIYSNSEISINEIDNLELINRGSGLEVRSNSGKIDKYTISDIDSGRLKQVASVIIGQNSYFTVVDYYGRVVLLTKNEFMRLVRVVGSADFANIKMSETTESRSASVGCIKTPFDVFKSDFWKSDLKQRAGYVSYFFECQLKARLNGLEYLNNLGINTDCYTETIEINMRLLRKFFELDELNMVALTKFIVEHIDSECIYDTDIIYYYLRQTKAELKLYTYSIRMIEDKDSKDYYYEIDEGFGNIYKNSEQLPYDYLPLYNDITVRMIAGRLKIIGLVGGFADKTSLKIVFDLIDLGTYDSYLDYTEYIEDTRSKYTTSKDNYKRALRLIGKLKDTSYPIKIFRDGDKVLNSILDIYEKIYSLEDYLSIGTSLNAKKPVDFDKEQLNAYGLTIDELEKTFLLMGMPKYNIQDLSKKAALQTVILLNRYEYIKVYSTDNIKPPKIKEGEWRTSNIDSIHHYILESYKEGKPTSQFMMYTDRVIYKSDGIKVIIKHILHKVLPICSIYADHAREKNAVSYEVLEGLDNTGKYITILTNNIFTKYNPFAKEIQELRCLIADKKGKDKVYVSACWDYGVSIVNGGYYIYIRANYAPSKLSESENSLLGLLDIDSKPNNEDLAIPVLRFRTYEDMYLFYNKVFMGNKDSSILWIESVLHFTNLVLRHTGNFDEITMTLLQELYRGSKTKRGISRETVSTLAQMPFDKTGVIL